jgi:hypothetical protein
MTQQASRYIALMTVFSTCLLLVVLAVALGLDASTGTALQQALPLALICGAALTFLLSDPFRQR